MALQSDGKQDETILQSCFGLSLTAQDFDVQFKSLAAHGELDDDGTLPQDTTWRQVWDRGLSGPIGDVYPQLFRALVKITDSWRMAVTRKGYLALVPVHTNPEDELCVFKGCNVPVLLEHGTKDLNYDTQVFVGTCFVVGLMDGEVQRLVSSGKLKSKPRWFLLR